MNSGTELKKLYSTCVDMEFSFFMFATKISKEGRLFNSLTV